MTAVLSAPTLFGGLHHDQPAQFFQGFSLALLGRAARRDDGRRSGGNVNAVLQRSFAQLCDQIINFRLSGIACGVSYE